MAQWNSGINEIVTTPSGDTVKQGFDKVNANFLLSASICAGVLRIRFFFGGSTGFFGSVSSGNTKCSLSHSSNVNFCGTDCNSFSLAMYSAIAISAVISSGGVSTNGSGISNG